MVSPIAPFDWKVLIFFRALALLSVLPLAGCIASAPGSGGGGGGGVGTATVSVSPSSATIMSGQTQTFTATVSGNSNTTVGWFVNGIMDGNATVGTITNITSTSTGSTALYTAPTGLTTDTSVSITAEWQANTSIVSPAATANLVPNSAGGTAVAVTPLSATVIANQTQTFTATVTGSSNTAVGWFVNGVLEGNSTVGTITNITNTETGSTAVYTAPAGLTAAAAATITAEWQANASIVSPPATADLVPILVTVSPAPTSLPTGGSQQFTAAVSAISNQAVTWSVAPDTAECPATNVGTITPSGLYTAPPTVPASPCSVTITAASVANPASVGSGIENVHVTVTINGPPNDPTAAPPSTIGLGANWQYTATVTGADPNAANGTLVQWNTYSPQANAGKFDRSTGFYTAPAVPPLVTATITATSEFDSSQTANVPLTIVQTDPLGTLSTPAALNSCGGNAVLSQSGVCYQTTVSCPGVADITAYLKVNTPPGASLGTVLFGVGTGGSGLYDDPNSSGYDYGYQTIADILSVTSNSGYNSVQISFGAPFSSSQPNGWLQGPGGVRRLACRYATLANYIYTNPTSIGLKLAGSANTSAPFCATGNSGGSGAIGYALLEYNLGSEFAMVEPTSGPPMSEINQGCSPCSTTSPPPICPNSNNVAQLCYLPSDASVIDGAYQSSGSTSPTPCTDALNGNPGTDASATFNSDSILAPQIPAAGFSLANTKVNLLFGDNDTSNAVPQGMVFGQSVLPAPTFSCLAGVDHGIPNFPPAVPPLSSGQQSIASDIIAMCK